MVGFLLLGLVAIALISIAATKRSASRRQAELIPVAQELGGSPPQGRSALIRGQWCGQPLEYELVCRGSGRLPDPWTELRLPIPEALPFSLSLRPETLVQRGLRARGLVIDIAVGDAEFDEAFIVEGAPADVIRALLTPEVRGRLLALRPLEIQTTAGQLVIAWPEHIVALESLRVLFDTAVSLAHLREAFDASDAALERSVPRVGEPYRLEEDAAGTRAAHAARAAEVAEIDRVHGRRKRLGVIVSVGFTVFWLVIWLLVRRR